MTKENRKKLYELDPITYAIYGPDKALKPKEVSDYLKKDKVAQIEPQRVSGDIQTPHISSKTKKNKRGKE